MANYVIDEKFLQQVELLSIELRNNRAGAFGGTHQSKSFGSSCEFEDYREYMAGDDITKIDWNVYSRFNKLFLKLYLDERQAHTKIYIDASRSMDYSNHDKAEQALRLAATFAYLSLTNMDKVSIYYIQDKKVHDVAINLVGRESFYNNIGKLNEIEFSGDSYISDSILPTNVGYGDGLSIIISDFLTDNNYEKALDYLADKRRNILCVQVLSKEEINPKIRGKVQLYDSEDINKIYKKNVNKDVINAYSRALEYVKKRIYNLCNARDAKYLFVNASESILEVFLKDLPEMGVLK
ncbi:MAG: DUF58 domain-containing protein [Anaeroplasma sp.]